MTCLFPEKSVHAYNRFNIKMKRKTRAWRSKINPKETIGIPLTDYCVHGSCKFPIDGTNAKNQRQPSLESVTQAQ